MSRDGRPLRPEIKDTFSLLVLNLTFRTTVDDLYPLFDPCGRVVDIHIPRDRITGQSRGFAFVRYKFEEEADEAIYRLDGKKFDGRQIGVQYAKYGPNAERLDRGKIKTHARCRSRSPYRLNRYKDEEYRRREFGRDRYKRDEHRDYLRRSRSRNRSPRNSIRERSRSRSRSGLNGGRSRSRSRYPIRRSRSELNGGRSRSRSRSPIRRNRSGLNGGRSRSRSRSPIRRSRSRLNGGRSISRSRSPIRRSRSGLNGGRRSISRIRSPTRRTSPTAQRSHISFSGSSRSGSPRE